MIPVEIQPGRRVAVQEIGVAFEVDRGGGQAPADVDRVLGEPRREGEVQRHADGPGPGLHTPSTEEPRPAGQVQGIRRLHREDVCRADQIEHVGHRVRPDLEDDVPWLAEHPEVERPGLELAQALVPGDRDLVGSAQPPGCQILLEAFVDRREQEIMADAELDSRRPGTLDEPFALLGERWPSASPAARPLRLR